MTYRSENEEIIVSALDHLAWQRRKIERLESTLREIATGDNAAAAHKAREALEQG